MTRPLAQPLFTGVGVALVTLFDDDGEVDAKATADHAAALVELGMRAVLVAGSQSGRATNQNGTAPKSADPIILRTFLEGGGTRLSPSTRSSVN